MRALHIALSIISTLLMASTLICGFWIHNNKALTDLASSANFHMWLGVAAGISVLVNMIITLIRK